MEDQDRIPFFREVAPGIYRGGQPTKEGYAHLKSLGVKTVVNLRHENSFIEIGRNQTEAFGMNYMSLPWTIYGKLPGELVDQFFSILENPGNYPVFFHCRRGVERTGLLTALYYLRSGQFSDEEAYQKAFEGFPLKFIWKPFVKAKFRYFKEKVAKR